MLLSEGLRQTKVYLPTSLSSTVKVMESFRFGYWKSFAENVQGFAAMKGGHKAWYSNRKHKNVRLKRHSIKTNVHRRINPWPQWRVPWRPRLPDLTGMSTGWCSLASYYVTTNIPIGFPIHHNINPDELTNLLHGAKKLLISHFLKIHFNIIPPSAPRSSK
jgi:hypothetical protein